MGRNRYQTGVLVGPWRQTRRAAERDAIRNNQAQANETGDGLIWRVPGDIEIAGEADPIPDS
jgi:hypothetical protein